MLNGLKEYSKTARMGKARAQVHHRCQILPGLHVDRHQYQTRPITGPGFYKLLMPTTVRIYSIYARSAPIFNIHSFAAAAQRARVEKILQIPDLLGLSCSVPRHSRSARSNLSDVASPSTRTPVSCRIFSRKVGLCGCRVGLRPDTITRNPFHAVPQWRRLPGHYQDS